MPSKAEPIFLVVQLLRAAAGGAVAAIEKSRGAIIDVLAGEAILSADLNKKCGFGANV
jgi:hypothetical protein